jgi:hypothetical protein
MYLRTFEGTFETLRRYLIYLLIIQVLLLFVTNINITTQINESIYLPYLYLYIHTSFVLYVYIHHYTCMLLILRILFYLLRTKVPSKVYVHNIPECLTVKNVRFTWYRLSNITVYSFHTLISILFYFIFKSKILV